MSSERAALQPSFQGHVHTTYDALVLFEACLQGHLAHLPRRLHPREHSSLICSGSVFIYPENDSGIKRWTDGITWSPSRFLGDFMLYRELDKPFPPGEKKHALKKRDYNATRPSRPDLDSLGSENGSREGGDKSSEVERQFMGSLIDNYIFKPDGLVKKALSVTLQGVTHHLVSYYRVHDVIANILQTPSQTEHLQYIRPRPDLVLKPRSRSRIGDVEKAVQDPDDYCMGFQDFLPVTQLPAGVHSAGIHLMQNSYLQTEPSVQSSRQ